jgi:hypothetical protein
VGAVGYLSEPLYAPRDRDGTSLLEPGQEGYAVLGQAWAALRCKDYALLKGPRQLVQQGYVNPHDSLMTPNTFEGVTLSGTVGPVEYYAGYLARMKPRNEDEFSWMTQQVEIARHHNGLGIASVRVEPWEDLSVYAAEYYLPNAYNTAFGRVSYHKDLGEELDLSLGFQYTDQRSVGAQLLGDFVTWNAGGQVHLSYAFVSLKVAFAFTGMANNITSSFGGWPGYLSLQVRDFDLANQNAWGVGLGYNFGRLGAPGVTARTFYAQGTNAVTPGTSRPVANVREGDFRVDWITPPGILRGFSFTFRAAVVSTGAPRLQNEFRILVNYEIPGL